MRNVFKSKFKITQQFGVNKEYYSKFSLQGHEGIDLVPTGSNWDILCPEDGVVVRDIDDSPSGKNYGKNFTVWMPNSHRAAQFCHLNSNTVKVGDIVKVGQVLGVMGDTGNTQGIHLHLNLFNVDDNGYRLNKDNGFLGGVNPLEWLNEDGEPSTTVSVLSDVFENLVRKSTIYDNARTKLNVEDSETVFLGEIDKLVGFEDQMGQKDQKISDLTKDLAELDVKFQKLDSDHEAMRLENAKLTQAAKEFTEKQSMWDNERSSFLIQFDDFKKLVKEPILKGWKKLVHDVIIRW
ncbi:MAG: peptidoglycan DD-metalloendopeptidase family protein [Patescibacteria group bacterium]